MIDTSHKLPSKWRLVQPNFSSEWSSSYRDIDIHITDQAWKELVGSVRIEL
jgi:hypothetical protein